MASPNENSKKGVYIKNRPATFRYLIEEKVTAGMVLVGSEIKTIRLGKVSFADSFCFYHKGEIWVKNLHIAEYKYSGYAGHDPLRERKLLLNKRELVKWEKKIQEKGYAIVPLAIFINAKGFAKMEIGLGKGKKLFDKRETIKDREAKRKLKDMGF